jgi:NAD-dependent deacetylase
MMPVQDDVRAVAELLSHARYAVALTGAGISTPSGIPDFRSPDSGLWTKVDPMAVASISVFRTRPEAFYEWMRPTAKLFLEAEPNPAHLALAELEEMDLLKAVITQNIDNLHQRAGSRRVLELHGHFREATCMRCRKEFSTEGVIYDYMLEGKVPRCVVCGGVLKPKAVFFGEPLPMDALLDAQIEAQSCDLMLVAGSSLQVVPAADLPFLARSLGADLIIVNYEKTPADPAARVVIHEDVADVLPGIVDLCRGQALG